MLTTSMIITQRRLSIYNRRPDAFSLAFTDGAGLLAGRDNSICSMINVLMSETSCLGCPGEISLTDGPFQGINSLFRRRIPVQKRHPSYAPGSAAPLYWDLIALY